LVAEVSLGRVGLVMGLGVSRLARNNADWHRLLEICALTGKLIVDEDGIYDPNHFNDRLIFGLKGTMSEAELHMLRARLIGGLLNKARRTSSYVCARRGIETGGPMCQFVVGAGVDEAVGQAAVDAATIGTASARSSVMSLQ
jgi:hypothetical protein